MSFLSLVLIALGLALDSFAVSISCGLRTAKISIAKFTEFVLIFGIFQGIMPVLGWFMGTELKKWITGVDHWIAFGFLSAIGLKMIIESLKGPRCSRVEELNTSKIILLAIATSIDALAIGVGFAFLKVSILFTALIICMTTLIMSSIGLLVGKRIGHFFENKIHIFGGVVLILIGVKILLEHLN